VLDHRRDRLVVDEEAVLDAVDAGVDRVPDRFGAVCVRGDAQPSAIASSTIAVVPHPNNVVRQEVRSATLPRRAANLDQLGAVFDLVAHCLADLVDPVGDASSTVSSSACGANAANIVGSRCPPSA